MTAPDYYTLPEDSTTVWRYLTLPKFLSLLKTRSVYLPRADQFEDRHEGAFTWKSIDDFKRLYNVDPPPDYPDMMQCVPLYSFVSCWHISEDESHAMWKIYGQHEESLAIESSVRQLKEAFPHQEDAHEKGIICQRIGVVRYIDYEIDYPRIFDDWMGPLFCKRKAYAYEKEIRIIRQELPYQELRSEARVFPPPPEDKKIHIDVDLKALVNVIHLAPSSPDWMVEKIEEGMTKSELDSIPRKPSKLDDSPEYGASKQ
jgi:hypothetical protein